LKREKEVKKKKSYNFEYLFGSCNVGVAIMACSCLLHTVSGNIEGKMFITSTHLCFSSGSKKSHKIVVSGDSIASFKITGEKNRMQFRVLMKNTEKNYIFKKLENEILSWMVGWFKNFNCIDIGTKTCLSLNDSSDNKSGNLKSSKSSESILKSSDFAHSESSIGSEDFKQTCVILKLNPEPTDPVDNTLQLINEEVENFLSSLEATVDALYK